MTDYRITDKKHVDTIKQVAIDDEKEFSLYRLPNNQIEKKKTHSDYNEIIIELDIFSQMKIKKKSKIVTKKGIKDTSKY